MQDGTGTADVFLDAGMRGWIVRKASKEYWRVAHWYELSDLIQDGYLCYAKCKQAYPVLMSTAQPTPEQRRHVMSLVQRAFCNHITDLAKSRMRLTDMAVSQLVGEEGSENSFWEKVTAPDEVASSGATVGQLLRSAPKELLDLITLLAQDAGFQRKRKGRRLVRETNNERYCRLLGLDPLTHNVVAMIRDHLK